jgi:DNA-binding beta-propeller fold protein YncE
MAGLAGLASAAAVLMAPSAAQATDTLPLPNYGDIVVDDVHQRVFVSGGPTTNGVVVTDFSGKVKKTINSQSGATGLVLSADSKSLYVALAAGDAISVIDTTTFAETARYPVGSQLCPTHLARTGTIVWFGYGCESDWNGKIGKLDTAATPPAVTLDQQGDAIFQRAPLLASATADAGPLVAGQLSLSLSTVRVFSVAGGALTAGASGDVVGASLADISLAPNAATMVTTSGSRDHAEAFAPGDLSRRGAYATGFRPNAVAVSPDNAFVAIGRNTGGADDVFVYSDGGSVPVNAFDLDSGDLVAPRGVAWSGDQKRLFVIAQTATNATPQLEIISRPTS